MFNSRIGGEIIGPGGKPLSQMMQETQTRSEPVSTPSTVTPDTGTAARKAPRWTTGNRIESPDIEGGNTQQGNSDFRLLRDRPENFNGWQVRRAGRHYLQNAAEAGQAPSEEAVSKLGLRQHPKTGEWMPGTRRTCDPRLIGKRLSEYAPIRFQAPGGSRGFEAPGMYSGRSEFSLHELLSNPFSKPEGGTELGNPTETARGVKGSNPMSQLGKAVGLRRLTTQTALSGPKTGLHGRLAQARQSVHAKVHGIANRSMETDPATGRSTSRVDSWQGLDGNKPWRLDTNFKTVLKGIRNQFTVKHQGDRDMAGELDTFDPHFCQCQHCALRENQEGLRTVLDRSAHAEMHNSSDPILREIGPKYFGDHPHEAYTSHQLGGKRLAETVHDEVSKGKPTPTMVPPKGFKVYDTNDEIAPTPRISDGGPK